VEEQFTQKEPKINTVQSVKAKTTLRRTLRLFVGRPVALALTNRGQGDGSTFDEERRSTVEAQGRSAEPNEGVDASSAADVVACSLGRAWD